MSIIRAENWGFTDQPVTAYGFSFPATDLKNTWFGLFFHNDWCTNHALQKPNTELLVPVHFWQLKVTHQCCVFWCLAWLCNRESEWSPRLPGRLRNTSQPHIDREKERKERKEWNAERQRQREWDTDKERRHSIKTTALRNKGGSEF